MKRVARPQVANLPSPTPCLSRAAAVLWQPEPAAGQQGHAVLWRRVPRHDPLALQTHSCAGKNGRLQGLRPGLLAHMSGSSVYVGCRTGSEDRGRGTPPVCRGRPKRSLRVGEVGSRRLCTIFSCSRPLKTHVSPQLFFVCLVSFLSQNPLPRKIPPCLKV